MTTTEAVDVADAVAVAERVLAEDVRVAVAVSVLAEAEDVAVAESVDESDGVATTPTAYAPQLTGPYWPSQYRLEIDRRSKLSHAAFAGTAIVALTRTHPPVADTNRVCPVLATSAPGLPFASA